MAAACKALLIGWDGADWQYLRPLLDRGWMPALAHLVRQGVTADLVSLPPYISPMLWTSIATGKRPWRHGVHGFTEVDESGRVRPVTSRSRRVPALWNMLSAAGRDSLVVGWYASHPAEAVRGVCVAETFFAEAKTGAPPFPARSVAPAALAPGLAELRVTAESLDPGLIRLLCPGLTPAAAARDPRALRLAQRVAEMYSIHNVALSLMETEPWDFAAVYFHFLDWIMHDFEPFLPPAAAHLPRALVERYGGVAEGACRLQDLLLAEMLRVAGPETRVFLVSDHGYRTGGARLASAPRVPAGIAAHHRPVGIFAAAGPGLRRGAHVGTASLLDVAPTLLHSLGLPTGADMDGRPLREIFAPPGKLATLRSWDERAPLPAGGPAADDDPAEEATLLERFAELGYVDPAVLQDPAAAEGQRIFNGWNEGMDLLDAGRPEEALPRLEAAAWHSPEIHTYAYWLARCQARLGLVELAEETCEVLRDFGDDHAQNRVYLGQVALAGQRPRAALAHFDFAAGAGTAGPSVQAYRAAALLLLGRWREAFDLLAEEARARPSAEVWLGIARCYLHRRQLADAEAAARHALTFNPRLAAAHLCLGRALARQKKLREAWRAFREARRLAPGWALVRQVAGRFFPGRMEASATGDRPVRAPERKNLLAEARARRAAWDARVRARRAAEQPVAQIPAPPPPGSSGRTFVIVSGLPRSGTSLLMQMLAAGGLPACADGVRAPDEHNPRGFFEWDAIRRLPKNPRLIEQAQGRAVKVVSALLGHLPREHRYKILAATRSAREIARSQAKMLGRDGDLRAAERQLAQHQEQWLATLHRMQHCEVLEVPYAEAVAAPAAAAARIAAFLGAERLPHPERMAAVVDPMLYRNRGGSEQGDFKHEGATGTATG